MEEDLVCCHVYSRGRLVIVQEQAMTAAASAVPEACRAFADNQKLDQISRISSKTSRHKAS
jgi:hypothetical protein